MKLLADECCSADLVTRLREADHDVRWVIESMAGSPDDEVLRRAYDEDRLLVTEDKDFGELVVRLQLPARGVVLLRFAEADEPQKAPRLLALLRQEGVRLRGQFVVLEAKRVRRRPLLPRRLP